jgi:DnaJ like chaperone protein
MTWVGKIGGAIAGFIVSGGSPIGAILGGFLGHQFDRGLNTGSSPFAAGASSAERQQVFFETTFLVMGHLAKADGRVSEQEIQAARTVMHRMQLRPEDVRRAIDLFNAGKRADANIDVPLTRLHRTCAGQPELIRTFLEIQMDMSVSKGSITAAERQLLWRIAQLLGVGRVELAHLEAVLRAQRSFGRYQTGQQHENALDQAYKALGLQSDASDQQVKTAYRRLMNHHHPDKLVAKGLPDSMMEVAKERTREIRSAYERLKEHRAIK